MEKIFYILASVSWIPLLVLGEDCTPFNINKTNISMDIYISPENKNEDCIRMPLLSSDRYLCSGTIWTLGEGTNLIEVVVSDGENDTAFTLKMINEEIRCGKSIWITNRPEYIVVSSNETLGNPQRNNIRNNKLQYDIISHVYEDMVQACQIKKLQNRNIIDLIEECTLALYLTILVLGYVWLKIVTSLFSILINCCTLRKVNKRRNSCCCTYIFSSLCSSLTNRHISLSQQHDINSLQIELQGGGKWKDEVKSVNSEFVYLNQDLYNY